MGSQVARSRQRLGLVLAVGSMLVFATVGLAFALTANDSLVVDDTRSAEEVATGGGIAASQDTMVVGPAADERVETEIATGVGQPISAPLSVSAERSTAQTVGMVLAAAAAFAVGVVTTVLGRRRSTPFA